MFVRMITCLPIVLAMATSVSAQSASSELELLRRATAQSGDANRDVRIAAIKLTVRLAVRVANKTRESSHRTDALKSLETAVRFSTESDSAVRREILLAVGQASIDGQKWPEGRAVVERVFRQALNDRERSVRLDALRQLPPGLSEPRSWSEAITSSCRSDDRDFRLAAFTKARWYMSDETAELLEKAVEASTDVELASAAAKSLSEDPSRLTQLTLKLFDRIGSREHKLGALRILFDLIQDRGQGREVVIKAALDHARDADVETRRVALTLMERCRGAFHFATAVGSTGIDRTRFVATLTRSLRDQDAFVRTSAAEVLAAAHVRGREVESELGESLRIAEESDGLFGSLVIAEAVLRLYPQHSLARQTIFRGLASEDEVHRQLALDVCESQWREMRLTPEIKELAADTRDSVRRSAIAACARQLVGLAHLDHRSPNCVELARIVQSRIADESEKVRREVLETIALTDPAPDVFTREWSSVHVAMSNTPSLPKSVEVLLVARSNQSRETKSQRLSRIVADNDAKVAGRALAELGSVDANHFLKVVPGYLDRKDLDKADELAALKALIRVEPSSRLLANKIELDLDASSIAEVLRHAAAPELDLEGKLLEPSLTGGPDKQRWALSGIAGLRNKGWKFASRVSPLVESDDPGVRLAALDSLRACLVASEAPLAEPGEGRTSGWPPPAWSDRVTLRFAELGISDGPMRQVYDGIRRKLDNSGYSSFGVFPAPNGFMILTRIERMREDFQPYPDDPIGSRWSLDWPPVWSMGIRDWLKSLFVAPQGMYRCMLFAITTDDVQIPDDPMREMSVRISAEHASVWSTGGLGDLPAELESQSTEKCKCHVFVYEFLRKQGGALKGTTVKVPGQISAMEHLKRTKLLSRP